MNNRRIGNEKEKLAANWLESKGCQIVETNFYCKYGEIDIVYRDRDYLVFGEVKYRKNAVSGHPLEAVSYAKQKKISSASLFFMTKNGISQHIPIRYDVISILGEQISVVENAFEPIIF